MTDDEMDAKIFAHWENWLDRSCRCGFPHPKSGHYGPPPEIVQEDGRTFQYPTYPGVMGGDDPIPEDS